MQVRSLSIKTTEILQLDLAIREEMENVIDELDALLFAVNFDLLTATQLKAIELRIHTLSQISQLISEKNLFAKKTASLTDALADLKNDPEGLGIEGMLLHLNSLRDLLRYTPQADTPTPIVTGEPNHRQIPVQHQFIPYTSPATPTPSPVNPEAEALLKVRSRLEVEFQLTTAALGDVLHPVVSAKEGQVRHLLSHATQVFQDLAQTAVGRIPKLRPTLDRIPCLVLSIRGQSFALPQKSVLRILTPNEYRSEVKSWECPGGRLLKVSGQPVAEICLSTALGLSPEAQKQNLPNILIETPRGAVLMTAETSGDFVPLVPDLNAALLIHIGPYMGAAIVPDADRRGLQQVILILSPEKIAEQAQASPASPSTLTPSITPIPASNTAESTAKGLVAVTRQNRLISIPMEDVSHVELVPVSALSSHEGMRSLRVGQRSMAAVDPDEVISSKTASITYDIGDFQAVILRQETDTIAILTREIIGPKQESNLTDFGFAPKPGIRGTALCDDFIVCALDSSALLGTFSHFSRATPKRAKIS